MMNKEKNEKSSEEWKTGEVESSAVHPDSQSATLPGKKNGLQTEVTPKSIKAYLQATWFWQVFGVCAMQKLWTKFLVATSLMSGIMAFMPGLELLTPIYDLNEMNRTEGVLMKVAYKGKTAYGKRIVIQNDAGKPVIFRGTIYNDNPLLRAAIGKRVTVWSQIQYDLKRPFGYECFWHIQEGEKVLIDYDGQLANRLKARSSTNPALLKFFLFMFIVPLIIVLIVCRKGTCKNI